MPNPAPPPPGSLRPATPEASAGVSRRASGARRRLAALATAGTVAALLVPAMGLASGPAVAAVPCAPAGNTATASADLLRLDLLDVGALGLGAHPLADVVIGDASADMAAAHPQRASALSRYLGATVAGITLPAGLPHTIAQQTAPPAHTDPDTGSAVSAHTAALDLGVGNVFASAGRPGAYSCGAANSGASVADATVLPGSNGRSLLALPHEASSAAGTTLVAGGGAGGGYASSAGAAVGLAEIDLLSGTAAHVGVRVVTSPTLTGTAGGSLATSSMIYTSPVLDVTLPGGRHVTLDAGHPSLDFATSANASAVSSLVGAAGLPLVRSLGAGARLLVHLSIGALTSHVGAHAVAGSASTLRLDVSLASGSASGDSALSGTALSGTALSGAALSGTASSGSASGDTALSGTASGGLPGTSAGVDIGAATESSSTGPGSAADGSQAAGSTVLRLELGALSVTATAPGGPAECPPAGHDATCGPSPSCPVALAAVPGSTGHAAACGPSPTCPATLAVPGHGYGYGPSCPPPSPCAQTTGYGHSCAPSSRPPHSVSPSPSVEGTTVGSPGGSLPVTGAQTAWIAGVATVLVALGRLMMVVARRRSIG